MEKAPSHAQFISADELARWLNLHVKTILRLARNGTIPSIRLSARILRFRLSDVEAALSAHATKARRK